MTISILFHYGYVKCVADSGHKFTLEVVVRVLYRIELHSTGELLELGKLVHPGSGGSIL